MTSDFIETQQKRRKKKAMSVEREHKNEESDMTLQPDNRSLASGAMTVLLRYEEALRLACHRIADGPQEYHEANTPEGWMEHFLAAAAGQQKEEF